MAPPRIDRALVLHVAKLAALSLDDAEADRFAAELRRIVDYVAELDTVDTREVPPTAHVQRGRATLRPDEPMPGLSHAAALSQAPEAEGGGFAVPPFVE